MTFSPFVQASTMSAHCWSIARRCSEYSARLPMLAHSSFDEGFEAELLDHGHDHGHGEYRLRLDGPQRRWTTFQRENSRMSGARDALGFAWMPLEWTKSSTSPASSCERGDGTCGIIVVKPADPVESLPDQAADCSPASRTPSERGCRRPAPAVSYLPKLSSLPRFWRDPLPRSPGT